MLFRRAEIVIVLNMIRLVSFGIFRSDVRFPDKAGFVPLNKRKGSGHWHIEHSETVTI
jgi:hypothetical protein